MRPNMYTWKIYFMMNLRNLFHGILSIFSCIKLNMVLVQSKQAYPRVCHILLGISCVLLISKKICQVKKDLISNSLA